MPIALNLFDEENALAFLINALVEANVRKDVGLAPMRGAKGIRWRLIRKRPSFKICLRTENAIEGRSLRFA